jgi:hypothetical protein
MDEVSIFILGGYEGDEALQDVCNQEESSGKRTCGKGCKYLYLAATRETIKALQDVRRQEEFGGKGPHG